MIDQDLDGIGDNITGWNGTGKLSFPCLYYS
jgi:hypothetical protein